MSRAKLKSIQSKLGEPIKEMAYTATDSDGKTIMFIRSPDGGLTKLSNAEFEEVRQRMLAMDDI